jgi:hypothetical protein
MQSAEIFSVEPDSAKPDGLILETGVQIFQEFRKFG